VEKDTEVWVFDDDGNAIVNGIIQRVKFARLN